MLPVLLRFGWHGSTFRVGSYAVLVFCGILAALLIVLRRAREIRLSPRDLLPVFTAGIIGGFLGARLAFFLQYGGAPFRGGLVLYGGLIGGLLAGLLSARWKGIPLRTVADLAAPGMLLAAAFGRVGCVLAGCCYGIAGGHGLSYPPGSHAYRDQLRQGLLSAGAPGSLPTVPITLIEAGVLLLLFAITSELWRRRLRPGLVLVSAGALYPAWRFVAEFWRADNAPYWPGGLTFSQGISLACLLACGITLLRKQVPQPGALPAYRRASVVQVLLLLASVGLSLGGVSCGSHPHSEDRGAQGVAVYRKPDPAKPAPQDSKPRTKKQQDDDDFFSDCFSDCIEDCSEDCMDDCTDAMCEGTCGGGGGDPSPEHEAGGPVFSALRPGKKFRGTLNVEAVVNKQWSLVIRLKGQISAGKPDAQGNRPLHLGLRGIDIVAGDLHWRGSGDVDLEVHPDKTLRLVNSTLPPEILEALSDLEAVTGNLLRGTPSDRPPSELKKRLQAELSVPSPTAEFSLMTTFQDHERWLMGDAKVVQDPPGTYKLFWSFRY